MIPQGKETAPAQDDTEAACVGTPAGGVIGADLASRGSCTRVKEFNLLIHELFPPFSEKLLDINVLYDLTTICRQDIY